MSYTALYRKFRPVTFADVKGQDGVVTTLKNQIRANRIGHAYLFCGTRGTGKTSVAKILAKAVNCTQPVDGEPCGECASCKAIAAGTSMNVIEIDAASNNGVDNIREIVEEVSYSPADGKYKVYIIDEVHMLSAGAFNALLKTLEEPPSYVIFILATTEVHKLPVTILSRCQRYDFKHITIDEIADRLREVTDAEGIDAEDKALRYIARVGDGSLRDALSLLDQCAAFLFGKKLTYDEVLSVLGAVDTEVLGKLFRLVLSSDVTGCISLLDDVIMQGRELGQFVTDFIWYLRNLLLARTTEQVEDVVDMSSENIERLREEAAMTDPETLMRYIRVFSELSGQLRYASQKRILIEVALIKLCRPAMETDVASLAERVRALEKQMEDGLPLSYGAPAMQYETGTGNPAMNGAGAAAVTGTDGAAAGNGGQAKAQILPDALPEEIKQLAADWKRAWSRTAMPMRNYLKAAEVYAEDDGLLLLMEEGLASDYFLKQEGHTEQLREHLSNVLGRNLQVTIQTKGKSEQHVSEFPDLNQIHMEIIEED